MSKKKIKQWILRIIISRYIKRLTKKYCHDEGDFIAITSEKDDELTVWLLDRNGSWINVENLPNRDLLIKHGIAKDKTTC